MAVPAFLASSFSYRVDHGVTDVADVIVSLRDELLNQQAPAWTEPVAGTFKSPVDGNGRFFDFDIVKITATRLSMVMRNDTGQVVADRRADITAVDEVRYYTGQFHCVIEFVNVSVANVGEMLACGVTELSPDSTANILTNTWATGTRSAAGTADGQGTEWNEYHMSDNGAMTFTRRARNPRASDNADVVLVTHGGRMVALPMEVSATPKGLTLKQPIGRIYQCMIVDDAFPTGAELTIPIDDALTGVFKVSVRVADLGARNAWRMA